MTPNRAAMLCTLLLAFTLHPHMSRAQAVPTATRTNHLSVFGGATGTFTGFDGGKNLGITVGGDFWWYSYRGFHPSIEFRGSYPIHDGGVASLEYALGGVRVDHHYGRLLPYGDFLFGRGKINYYNNSGAQYVIVNGIPQSFQSFLVSTSNVYSFGGGSELSVTDHISLQADYQYQGWSSPVGKAGAPGNIHPSVLTAAVAYHFGSSHPHPRHHYDLTLPPAPRPVVVQPAAAQPAPPPPPQPANP